MRSWTRPVAGIVAATLVVLLLMAIAGMGPNFAPVIAAGLLIGAGVWLVADLASVATTPPGPSTARAPAPTARPDRRVTALRNGLAYGRPDRGSLLNLHATLVDLVDDQLRAVHNIDRSADPAAARAVIGDDLYAFVVDPRSAELLTKQRSVDRILTLIERI